MNDDWAVGVVGRVPEVVSSLLDREAVTRSSQDANRTWFEGRELSLKWVERVHSRWFARGEGAAAGHPRGIGRTGRQSEGTR